MLGGRPALFAGTVTFDDFDAHPAGANTGPVVNVTQLTGGNPVTGEVTFQASVTGLPTRIEFRLDNVLRAVSATSPASWTLDSTTLHIRRYWNLNPSSDVKNLSAATDTLDGLLQDTVKLQMVSDVPIGLLLSGGLDSSSVVAWMSRASNQPVKTYSIGFKDSRFNELPYAREAADHFGTDHHEKIVEADAFVAASFSKLVPPRAT